MYTAIAYRSYNLPPFLCLKGIIDPFSCQAALPFLHL